MHSRIACLVCIGANHIVVGTEAGYISVYDAQQQLRIHVLANLGDAVLCLKHYEYQFVDEDEEEDDMW